MLKYQVLPVAGPPVTIDADNWSIDNVGTLSFHRSEGTTLAYGPRQWIWVGQVDDGGGIIGVAPKTR